MFEQKNLKTFKVELDLPSSSLAPWYIWNPTIEVFFADEIRLSLIEFVGLLFYFIYYLKYKYCLPTQSSIDFQQRLSWIKLLFW